MMASPVTPSKAIIALLAPDGYYTYLDVTRTHVTPEDEGSDAAAQQQSTTPLTGGGPATTIDEDVVRKAYRKLSLKHHPDKPGGDADTFRILNRAQKVLLNPKLRQQYDILGIDLDDDEAVAESSSEMESDGKDDGPNTAQGIVHEIASMALTSVMQLTVRTALMGTTSVLLVRYRLTFYPLLLFMGYVAYQSWSQRKVFVDGAPPLLIVIGLLGMHFGKTSEGMWTYTFWGGEALVIGMMMYNSASVLPKTKLILGAITVVAILASLCFRGNFWNYAIALVMELLLAVFIALAFPVMELILEAILNEKLRKVGDKVRAHHKTLDAYYRAKLKEEDR